MLALTLNLMILQMYVMLLGKITLLELLALELVMAVFHSLMLISVDE